MCKQFRDIHASHSGLVQRVHLTDDFSVTSLPSLPAWLRQSKSSEQICNSPVVDAVLAVLASFKHSIKWVDVCHITTCTISIVATFTNLEKCALFREGTEELDLTPLRVLPKLCHLILQGEYKQLYHITGLTQLECVDAKVLDS